MRSRHEASTDPRSSIPRGGRPAASPSPRKDGVKKGENAQTNATVGVLQPDYESRRRQARRGQS